MSAQPPPWAISIVEDIKSIKTSVAKIENVEKTVNSISLKLSKLETKVDTIDKRVVDVEAHSTFISGTYEEQSSEQGQSEKTARFMCEP